jgi:RNA polymerase sigma-70 factor (ECF subfamily)
MYNVCYRIVNQQEEAEDVLQEAFVRMFRQLDSYRKEASFGAWFKRIVVNGALNHIKKRERLTKNLENINYGKAEYLLEEEEEDDLPNYSVNQIQNALELLPEGYRVVFCLYLFEEYTHKQIAEELKISESTSKSQLNRAKKKMKELLTQRINERN